jgi:hypothetical protein
MLEAKLVKFYKEEIKKNKKTIQKLKSKLTKEEINTIISKHQ